MFNFESEYIWYFVKEVQYRYKYHFSDFTNYQWYYRCTDSFSLNYQLLRKNGKNVRRNVYWVKATTFKRNLSQMLTSIQNKSNFETYNFFFL